MLFKKQCKICDPIRLDFHKNEYFRSFKLMKELVEKGDFSFEAGSCPLDELEMHIEVEDLYTLEHYFKCKCGQYFYTGFCIRGLPKLKIINKLPNNIQNTISGHYGTYFNKS